MTAIAYRLSILPWTPSPEEERRFRKVQSRVLAPVLVLGLVVPWLPVFEADRDVPPEVPPRYARLVLEKRPAPPPPALEPVVREVEPEPVAETRPEPVADTPAPVPEPRSEARERAARAGVMAFADALADLRDNDAVSAVTDQSGLVAGSGETEQNARSLITARTGRATGGINTAALSRNTGSGGLAGRGAAAVESRLAGAGNAAERGGGDGRAAARSREEIELVFDRNKGAIYALYNRALRADPTLRGKLVLRLTIAPDGVVTHCEVVSSELDDAEFERKLVARVRLFRFEAKDVATVTTTKPIDFFPA